MNASSTLRAAYGTDSIKNAMHGSSNNVQKTSEMGLFFGR